MYKTRLVVSFFWMLILISCGEVERTLTIIDDRLPNSAQSIELNATPQLNIGACTDFAGWGISKDQDELEFINKKTIFTPNAYMNFRCELTIQSQKGNASSGLYSQSQDDHLMIIIGGSTNFSNNASAPSESFDLTIMYENDKTETLLGQITQNGKSEGVKFYLLPALSRTKVLKTIKFIFNSNLSLPVPKEPLQIQIKDIRFVKIGYIDYFNLKLNGSPIKDAWL